MSTTARHETMQRKPILMPPSMIKKVDKMAKNKKVSFAEIVREAVNAFDSEASSNDVIILEALADLLIGTVKNVTDRMSQIEEKMEITHASLEAGGT